MRQLFILQGLPGAGKTTRAQELMDAMNDPFNKFVGIPRPVRVNQDDIRAELGWTDWASWDFTGDAEAKVTPLKMQRIEDALQHPNAFVISDDTNLNPKVLKALEALAHRYDAVVTKRLIETPPPECVRRDALRGGASVGAKVIYDMADKYRLTEKSSDQTRFAKVTDADREGLRNAIICDLDGTLSLFMEKGHRGPYDAGLADQDDLNVVLRMVLRALETFADIQVLYVSGRYERFRPQTMAFLKAHNCPVGPLYMRKDDDTRKDWIVKGSIFDAHIRGRYNVRLVFDDRNQVVDFWRSIGLTCWQVAKGDF